MQNRVRIKGAESNHGIKPVSKFWGEHPLDDLHIVSAVILLHETN